MNTSILLTRSLQMAARPFVLLFRFLKKIAVAIFGRLQWSPPRWLSQSRAAFSNFNRAHPLITASGIIAIILLSCGTVWTWHWYQPLRRTSRDPIALRGRRIIMPEAAFLTLEMLNQPRPEISSAYSDQVAPVFWKTGTSHGFRDAWSVAVFNHYVLAIWIGNFDGRANGNFVGRIAAAPLLFQIIDSLRAGWPEPSQPHLPPPGANLKRVSFCAVSGDLPEPYCTQQVEGWFIPGISPIKLCDVHQEVLVDAASGLRVPRDDGTRQLRREVYEFWPSEFLSIFRRAGVPRKLPPPFLPGTSAELIARTGNEPRIVSPAEGHKILLTSAGTIALRAKTDADVREIYWFAGNTFIARTNPQDVVAWKASPGSYELTALDDHGRAGSCAVTVQ